MSTKPSVDTTVTGIAGLAFVATGPLEQFGFLDEYTGAHDLSDLKEFIEERGGFLRSAVSSKTDYLICNDTTIDTKKLQKAVALGTPIITEAQFVAMAEGSSPIERVPPEFEISRNVLKAYTGHADHVVIPNNVTAIDERALFFREMTEVTIPENVTRIGKDALFGCYNLKTMHILCGEVDVSPTAVSKQMEVTAFTFSTDEQKALAAFRSFVSVPLLKIPLLIHALRQDASSLLRGECVDRCVRNKDELMQWIIEHRDVELLERLFFCFKKKIALDTLDKYIEAAKVSPEMTAFLLRYKDANYTVSQQDIHEQRETDIAFGTAERTLAEWRKIFAISATEHGYCIKGYKGEETEVVVPAVIAGKPVTAIGEKAFAYNQRLTSITLPDSITEIGKRAFVCCTALTSITIPANVQKIGADAFSTCEKLTSVTIPESVIMIEQYAFADCRDLTTVTICNRSDVTIGSLAFRGCPSLTTVTIHNPNAQIAPWVFDGSSKLTLHALAGSTAEKYAKKYRIPFVAKK